MQQLRGRAERGGVTRRAETRRDIRDCRQHLVPVRRRPDDNVRPIRKRHDGHIVSRRRLTNGVDEQLPGAGDRRGGRHAERRVDRDDGEAAAHRGSCAEEWPRERERKQHQGGHPERQEQQLAQPARGRVFDGSALEQRDRREPDPLLRMPLQQMQDDGHRRGDCTGKKQRREERH